VSYSPIVGKFTRSPIYIHHACLLFCALAIIVPPESVYPQAPGGPHRAPRRKPATASLTHPCGTGILTVSAPLPTQGSLLLLELRSPTPLTEVKGSWTEKEIPFWQESKPDSVSARNPQIWRALLGIDLELKSGAYTLGVKGESSDTSQNVGCSASIAVKEGKFATERLTVAPNFVEPNPEQLARAEAERQKLRAIFATITPERLWQGSFRLPLDGAYAGSNFGKRRILNGQAGSPHSGADFPAPAGTDVFAAQRGRVVLAEPLYFSGNTVVLDHGLGLYTFYGHFESIAVQAGDLVETGALLGKVGATGRVTGPHLHWGLTVNRSRVNPVQLLALFRK
jgi:murein DD-endopeptidase MepM/ murein hydrolase activator NlpD